MKDNRRRLMIDLGDLGRRQGFPMSTYDGTEDTAQKDPGSSPMTMPTDELRERLNELRTEIERERATREKEVERLRQDHAAEVERMRADHTAELERLHARLAEALAPQPGFLERLVAAWRRPR
jgi:FtsZ-binding cell division protein ZapB